MAAGLRLHAQRREAVDHPQEQPGGSKGPQAAGDDAHGLHTRLRPPGQTGAQDDRVAEQAHGVLADRSADLGVHGRERLADDLEPLWARDAPPGDERRGDSSRLHSRGDLRPRAVDDHDRAVDLGERGTDCVGGDAAAELEDDRHVVYSAFSLT